MQIFDRKRRFNRRRRIVRAGSRFIVEILVGLVIVLGAYSAVAADSSYANREPVDKPVAEMSFMEAGQHAKQPGWYNWLIPLVGIAGVMLGGRDSRESE